MPPLLHSWHWHQGGGWEVRANGQHSSSCSPQGSGNTHVILNAPGSACATGSSAPTLFDPGTTSHAHSMPPIFIPLYVPWTYCLCALTTEVADTFLDGHLNHLISPSSSLM